jgi:hypothetical protein
LAKHAAQLNSREISLATRKLEDPVIPRYCCLVSSQLQNDERGAMLARKVAQRRASGRKIR